MDTSELYSSQIFEPALRPAAGLASLDPNAAIAKAVRALMAALDLGPYDFAHLMGVSYATARRRLKGIGDVGWTAAEVLRVAALFDQPLADLFAGKVDLDRAVAAEPIVAAVRAELGVHAVPPQAPVAAIRKGSGTSVTGSQPFVLQRLAA